MKSSSSIYAMCAALLLLLAGAMAPAVTSAAGKPAKKTRVALTVKSKKTATVAKQKKLVVKVRSNRRARVRLSVAWGKRKNLFRSRTVRFKRKGTKRVAIRLSSRGRKAITRCRSPRLTVTAKYQRGRKKARSRTRQRLAAQPCQPAPPVLPDPATTPGCDPIDPAACMAPFPNDYFTRPDTSTGTGKRLDFQAGRVPANEQGVPILNDSYNRNDGFSPNSVIVTRIAGLNTPEVFRENGIVSQLDIGAYAEPDQKVLLIDTVTGQRVPIWAELDMVPGTPNPHADGLVQGTADQRSLLIHPAQSLEYGRRYVVAVRNITAGGNAVPASEVFGLLRDRLESANPQVEERRAQLEGIFSSIEAAGVERSSLNIAWDFTVASEENLTERLVSMRDDAFDQLGDTNLADGIIQGAPPEIRNVQTTFFGTCADDNTNCAAGESRFAFKKVTGTITVPCYMNAPGTTHTTDPDLATVPCASGSRLNYAPGSDLPAQKMAGGEPVTWDAPFTCLIPRAGKNLDEMAEPGVGAVLFGHGLLQSNNTTEVLGRYPAGLEAVSCGTDWLGLSSPDLTQHLLKMINIISGGSDLSLFDSLPDRTQQGYINTLYLARAMAHEDGFAAMDEFRDGSTPLFEIDQEETGRDLSYFGISLGGINGGAITAVAPDWTRSTLSVPGIGFGTLLFRSIQFNRFLPTVYEAYQDPLERAIGLSMIQILWDRGEPSAYSHSILDGIGTPPHEVLIHQAFGDHQVANIQTETLARSIGAKVKAPVIAPGRIDDLSTIAQPEGRYLFTPMDEVDPYWNIPELPSSQFNQAGGLQGSNATMVVTDTGPVRTDPDGPRGVLGTMANPDRNIAPLDGDVASPFDGFDPHQPGATSPALQQMNLPYLLGQGLFDPCGDGPPDPFGQPPFPTPTSSPDPVPCPAPAINYPGNGL